MIYLNTFLSLIQFEITDSSKYLWKSFGPNARYLDNETEVYSLSCVFDTKTQEIYLLSFSLNAQNSPTYHWVPPSHYQAYIQEHIDNNLDYTKHDDECPIIYCDTVQNFINTVHINTDLPKQETVSIELDTDLILALTKIAMEKNITLDTLINNILRDFIEHEEKLKNNGE